MVEVPVVIGVAVDKDEFNGTWIDLRVLAGMAPIGVQGASRSGVKQMNETP